MTAVTPATPPYGRATRIPYLRKTTYVFPDASTRISQAHKDRYPVLKDILQRNIESSPKLCDYTTCISYELRMCGCCVAEATPSILVFCPFGKLKKIKALLQQPHIRSQFESEITASTFVNFGLFFWAREIDMLAFHEIAAVIPVQQATDGVPANETGGRAPWSLRIYNGDNSEINTATMACMIQVGRDQFGLTTAHAFHQPLATSYEPDDSDSDDEEYDMSMEQDDHSEGAMDVQPALPIDGRRQTVQLGKCEVHIPPHDDSSAWMKEHANLDWALLKLGPEISRLSIHATATEALPIVDRLPQECVDVLIVTTSLHEVPAIIYHIPSYIGGAKGSQAAEVWTVGALSNETRECHNLIVLSLHSGVISQTLRLVLLAIRRGDSGSIVVDARSGELYGMVVASNPFGDIHIAPFAAILAQVEELFEVQDAFVLNLPLNPIPPLLEPTLETDRLAENQNTQEVVVCESEETMGREDGASHVMQEELLREAGLLILHEADRGMLAWPEDDSLRLPLFPGAKERTNKPTPKMDHTGSITTAQGTTKDELFPPQLHTVDVEDVQPYPLSWPTLSTTEDGLIFSHVHTVNFEDVQPYSPSRPTLSTTEDGPLFSQTHTSDVEDVQSYPLSRPTLSTTEDRPPLDTRDVEQGQLSPLPRPKLTLANLSLMGTQPVIYDVRSWVNGGLKWISVAESHDKSNGTSCGRTDCSESRSSSHSRSHSRGHSRGHSSLDFGFVPTQPSSIGLNTLGIGAAFK